MEQVRELMRNHDIYVLPSNAYEGWGAVISEALEEGMCVLASIESGAGATLLPPENLFPAGDVEGVARKLRECVTVEAFCNRWTAEKAAQVFLKMKGFLS